MFIPATPVRPSPRPGEGAGRLSQNPAAKPESVDEDSDLRSFAVPEAQTLESSSTVSGILRQSRDALTSAAWKAALLALRAVFLLGVTPRPFRRHRRHSGACGHQRKKAAVLAAFSVTDASGIASEGVEDVLERVDRLVLDANLVMKVRSGAAAGRSDEADHITALDLLAWLHIEA
jgi:hypothetical protein